MTGRLKLILAALAFGLASGCFSIQAPLPTPTPVPAPRLPPTQPNFNDAKVDSRSWQALRDFLKEPLYGEPDTLHLQCLDHSELDAKCPGRNAKHDRPASATKANDRVGSFSAYAHY